MAAPILANGKQTNLTDQVPNNISKDPHIQANTLKDRNMDMGEYNGQMENGIKVNSLIIILKVLGSWWFQDSGNMKETGYKIECMGVELSHMMMAGSIGDNSEMICMKERVFSAGRMGKIFEHSGHLECHVCLLLTLQFQPPLTLTLLHIFFLSVLLHDIFTFIYYSIYHQSSFLYISSQKIDPLQYSKYLYPCC